MSSTSRLHIEADARAFLSAALLPEPVERLEELSQLFLRQARAHILDADPDASLAGLGARDLDRWGDQSALERLSHSLPHMIHLDGADGQKIGDGLERPQYDGHIKTPGLQEKSYMSSSPR